MDSQTYGIDPIEIQTNGMLIKSVCERKVQPDYQSDG